MEFIDTHCHLQFEKLSDNLENVIERAINIGVKRMVCVGTSLDDSRRCVEIASKVDGVWAAAGSHPHEAEHFLKKKTAVNDLQEMLKKPKIVAAGELGLDFYKNYAPKLEQEKSLRLQIEAALPSGLPFIFHIRDAWSDFWRIYDEYKNIRGVVHSFSSGTKQLDAALSRGLHIGLNGIMTFTYDEAQLEAARQVPLDKLVLETDAPFLAPQPYRGQVCEPKHVVDTAGFLAKLRDQPLEEISKATTSNAINLFKLHD
ncbi:MAG TPA: TatD family hydrolase [Candidatus Babeliales bacterium]|nr:TatD family hydrolase [Candidatus Babeliales bacterium]